MIRICKNCGKEFHHHNGSRGMFCCHPCYIEYRRKDNAEYRTAQYVTLTCERCGKTFKRRKSEAYRGAKTFCSKTCAGSVTGGVRFGNPPRPSVEKQCEVCGSTYKAKASRPNSRYCSKACRIVAHSTKMVGQGNSHYKHGKSAACGISQARKHYEQKCIICGFDILVQVHHITPKAEGGTNDPANLAILCPNHHAMADRNMILRDTLFRLAEQARKSIPLKSLP